MRWSIIAGHLPGRTDNEIKNYWNAHLSKKVAAAGTAAGEGAGGDGESGVREEINDGDGDDDGEVCSEDNGSTVVDADRDDVDDAADDSVDSMDVSSKATRKAGGNKRGGSVGPDEETVLKRKKKANKKRESSKDQPEEPMKEENEENNNINNNNKKKNKSKNGTDKKEDDDAAADGCRKRKKTCGGTDSCCDHICGSTNKKQKKERKKQVHASTVTHGESGSKEDVSNDSINKTQKKRRKVAKPANLQPGSTDTEPSSKQAIEEQAPCRPPSKLKTKAKLEPKAGQVPDADASTGAAACCHAVCGAPEEMGPLAHVEHVVESAEGGLLLEGPCHLEYTGMAVDLLEAIESDDAGLMPVSGGSMVSNENLLLDYFDMSCTDGACCTTGGLTPPTPRPCEDADSVVSGWPASPPMTLPPPSMLGEEAMFTSMGSFSTSSSCIDLVDLHLCADGCGNNTNAGTAVDDAIGSLPWEAEEDFWHILSEFAGDMDTAGPAPKEEEEKPPPCTSLHQPMTMMTQALHSNSTAGCRADDVLADDALENSWFLADMFLS